jgi:hypothetical protein
MRPMIKLFSQLEATERATPLARVEVLWTSEGSPQGTGPQPMPCERRDRSVLHEGRVERSMMTHKEDHEQHEH